MFRYLLFFAPLLVFLTACDPTETDGEQPTTDTFDRQAMLEGWATSIESRYEGYKERLEVLQDAARRFMSEPTEDKHATLRQRFDEAYTFWQTVDPLLVGRAEEIRLRERSNTYPANVGLITESIAARSTPNLELPSMTAAQGFPALDYLIYGIDREQLGDVYHANYMVGLIQELKNIQELAARDFTQNRSAFITNDGNSATASIDRTVNDYIFYYEKFLRAGKVGIPAGVFSDDPLADRVESRYGGNSKSLLTTALVQTRHFFVNQGLREYLDVLNVRRDGELLSAQIMGQFDAIDAQLADINDDFAEQIQTDNAQMLALYDEMQRLVVLLKVDMLQALNINVDYVDADGD